MVPVGAVVSSITQTVLVFHPPTEQDQMKTAENVFSEIISPASSAANLSRGP